MRAVRSFDPCLPCGVHMYLGKGKTLRKVHSPMFGEHVVSHGRPADTREQVERVETLLEQVEALPDPDARDIATELVQALLDLYGEGLARMVARVAEPAGARSTTSSSRTCSCCTGSIPCRWRHGCAAALDEVRPYLASHGGNVELVSVEDGVVRLRMEGSCSGCPSSTMTLKLAIEDAIHKAAPDVVEHRGGGRHDAGALRRPDRADAARRGAADGDQHGERRVGDRRAAAAS